MTQIFAICPIRIFARRWDILIVSSTLCFYILNTRDTMRWLKKPSKEPMSHVRTCMWSWDCSKFLPRIQFLFEFEPSQDFRTKKTELTRDFYTWSIFRLEIKLNGSNFSHLKITCVFRHVTLAPSMAFWAISGYSPY